MLANSIFFWDTNGASAGAGATPTGTWDSGISANWTTDPAGATATSVVTTTNLINVYFVAGPSASSGDNAYTVTVSGTQSARSLNFQAAGAAMISGGAITLGNGGVSISWYAYNTTVNGAVTINSPVTLGGSQTWLLNATSASLSQTGSLDLGAYTLTVAGIGSVTLSGVIGGTGGLTVTGAGTTTLNGSAVNTYTGNTTINGNNLIIDFTNLASATDLINNGSTLVFGGGSLTVLGKSSGSTSQTFDGVVSSAFRGPLLVNPNGGTGTTVNLGTMANQSSWPQGSSLLLGTAASAGGGTVTITTTNGTLTHGIYGGRILYTSDGGTTIDYATTTSGSSPYVFSALPSGSYLTMPTSGGSAGDNDVVTSWTTLSGTVTCNTLKLNLSGAGILMNGQTLIINSGGLLSVGTVGEIRAPGIITAGAGSNYDLLIRSYASGYLSVGSIGSGSIVVQDNGGNPVHLTMTGPSGVTWNRMGYNTYSGGTHLSGGGELQIRDAVSTGGPGSITSGPFGGGAVHINGATIGFGATYGGPTSGQTISNVFNFVGGSSKLILDSGGVWGTLVLDGGIVFTNNPVVTLASQSSQCYYYFTGLTTLQSDVMLDIVAPSATTQVQFVGGFDIYGGTRTLAAYPDPANSGTALLTLAGVLQDSVGSGNTLILAGSQNILLGQLTAGTNEPSLMIKGTATVTCGGVNYLPPSINVYAGTLSLGGYSQTINGLNGQSTGTVTTSGTCTLTLNGTGTYSHTGTISGSGLAVTINNAGLTQSFAGANTYTGATTITAGKLAISNTSGSATGTGAVTVVGPGTLSATSGGAISGMVYLYGTLAVAAGANLALNGGVSLESGSVINAQLRGITATPLISVTTSFSAGSLITINITGTPIPGATYHLLQFTSALTSMQAAAFAIGSTVGPFEIVNNTANNSLDLVSNSASTFSIMSGGFEELGMVGG